MFATTVKWTLLVNLSRPSRKLYLTCLLLALLAGVNTVLAWHGVVHHLSASALLATNDVPQQPSLPDDHCTLCLSAHGLNGAPTATAFVPVPPSPIFWQAPVIFSFFPLPAPSNQQARAPPFLLSRNSTVG